HPLGPARICLSLGGCSERRPWVRVASTLPAGALPLPANRTPPEGAPRRVDRDMSPLAKMSPYVKSSIRYWKRKWEFGGKLGAPPIPVELREYDAPGPVLMRRLRTKADINPPTVATGTVENDPQETLRATTVGVVGKADPK